MRPHTLVPLFLAASASALPEPFLQIERSLIRSWFGGGAGCRGQVALGTNDIQVVEGKTIYQTLKDDKEYSRLVKAIDISDKVVSLLNDSSANITFFAAPNKGLPQPPKPRHDLDVNYNPVGEGIARNLGELVVQIEELENSDDDDKKHRKKGLERIVRHILAYHILPEKSSFADLLENTTFATNLTLGDGSYDYEPLRITVHSSNIPQRTHVNLISDIIDYDVEATNGVMHVISLPLLPPPSAFQELFLVPSAFSYVTSALQRVGLTDELERRYIPGHGDKKGTIEGNPTVTFFAPTSKSFESLPKKLQLFLFSPFGERALRKLLQYHIVPSFVLHTDYTLNATTKNDSSDFFDDLTDEYSYMDMTTCGGRGDLVEVAKKAISFISPDSIISRRDSMSLPPPVYSYRQTLPTCLDNHTLQVEIAKYRIVLPLPGPPRYITKFLVNSVPVRLSDVVARNGAIHVIGKLLNPRGHGKDIAEQGWEDWEEWLPQWAQMEK